MKSLENRILKMSHKDEINGPKIRLRTGISNLHSRSTDTHFASLKIDLPNWKCCWWSTVIDSKVNDQNSIDKDDWSWSWQNMREV